MTITATRSNDSGAAYRVQGRHFDDAAVPAAAAISLGFTPRYFAWINLTDRITWEWFEGNANGTTLKTAAAGTRTLDTADVAISVDAGSGNQTGGAGTVGSGAGARVITDDTKTQTVGQAPGGVVTVAAAAIAQNKQYQWVAIG